MIDAASSTSPIRRPDRIVLAIIIGALGLFAACRQPLPTHRSARPVQVSADPRFHRNLGDLVAAHGGKSGAYVLEKGRDSLMARAWLTDQASRTVDVQYFIWSTDNIGILAAESLLRAAERGARVRVIVDDFLLDADEMSLLALAAHPNIAVEIYNPRARVGISRLRRAVNLATGFRDFNQRMHDKTFTVDGAVGITGGRNVADEYFDLDREYNFRDRDVLVMGPVVADIEASFERFWDSPLTVPVETLLAGPLADLSAAGVERAYGEIHAYAENLDNYDEDHRRLLEEIPARFGQVLEETVWGTIEFISDCPGKNPGDRGLEGGGRTTGALAGLLRQARSRVRIQTPYLVMSDATLALFKELVDRGVDVRISTNSLASTDNLPAFSGYRKKRRRLTNQGLKIFEFRPHPEVYRDLAAGSLDPAARAPIFAIHAKTMVIDGETLYIGTFNLDPRSAHLNTEVGVLIRDPGLARSVERRIETDMRPENSWAASTGAGDAAAGLLRRLKVRCLEMLPIEPIL